MRLLEKILVPVDFSASTDSTLQSAAEFAKVFGSEIILQYVLPPAADTTAELKQLFDEARAGAQSRLEECRTTLEAAGVKVVEVLVDEGIPDEEIVTRADERDVNVIMIKASNNAASTQQRLGTTAAGVRRTSTKPVWLVQPGQSQLPREILCPIDFSSASERALRNAIHIARQLSARLTVVTVVPPLTGWTTVLLSVSEEAEEAHVQLQSRRFDEFVKGFDFFQVNWDHAVRRGDPAAQIVEAARDRNADLLVIGSAGRSGLWRMFVGSITEKVAHQLPCSVLTMTGENAIRLRVDEDLTDLETHYERGRELLQLGFPEEASRQFEHCVNINDMFLPGWEALTETYERLGKRDQMQECRDTVARIKEAFSWRMIEADIRSRHPLLRKLFRKQ